MKVSVTVTKRRSRGPADEPAYTMKDAARFLHLPPSTLTFWFRGGTFAGRPRPYLPVLKMADREYLSFTNLAEAYILRGLRREHQMPLPELRSALHWLARELHDPHPLVHPDIRVHGASLLLAKVGQLIDTSPEGQMVMEQVFAAHLQRIEWSGQNVARLYPFASGNDGMPSEAEPKFVRIDPTLAYGRPAISSGVRTSMISNRFEAGDSIKTLVEDYESTTEEIEEAIRYERVGARYPEAA